MTYTMTDPADIINAFQVLRGGPSCVYAIVPHNGPVSFYSQQKRAFNLVAALSMSEQLQPSKKIGVIGAGLAGLTASAAFKMLGCDVTLFEAHEAMFHQQHGNHSRYIHPNVIDWPRPGSESPITDLPFLNWIAGDCASVTDDIEDQWNSLGIPLEKGMRVEVSGFENDGAYISCPKPFFNAKFSIVVVAVGFGPRKNLRPRPKELLVRRTLASTVEYKRPDHIRIGRRRWRAH